MRFLFVTLCFLLLMSAGATWARDNNPQSLHGFAQAHAPHYAQQALERYYVRSDDFTKAFVTKTWDKAQAQMDQAGIAKEDQTILYLLGMWESTWNHRAKNPRSSAYGLCQTMLSDHGANLPADFASNPVAQLKWCDRYANQRYGGYKNALAHWHKHKWW